MCPQQVTVFLCPAGNVCLSHISQMAEEKGQIVLYVLSVLLATVGDSQQRENRRESCMVSQSESFTFWNFCEKNQSKQHRRD